LSKTQIISQRKQTRAQLRIVHAYSGHEQI